MTSVSQPEDALKSGIVAGKRKFAALQPSSKFTTNKTLKVDHADKENQIPSHKAILPQKTTLQKPLALKSSVTLKKTIVVEDKENLPPKTSRDIISRPAVKQPLRDVKNEKDTVSTRLLSKLPVLSGATKAKPELGKQGKLTVYEDVPDKKPKRRPLAVLSSSSVETATKKPLATAKPVEKKEIEKKEEIKKATTTTECKKEEKKVVVESESEEEIEIDGDVEDIDVGDADDPQQCHEYLDDIFKYLRKLEKSYRPRSDYLARQKEVNTKMREVLVDWLIEVATKFRLLPESLFLGVAIMDIFFSKKQVGRSKMQLVGIGALLIASKFEEVSCPVIDDFVWISAEAYKREEIIRVEKIILETLGFNLSVQTPIHFLRRFSKAAKSNTKTHTLCKYLIEMSLMDYNLLKYVPSLVAASAVYIARKMTGTEPAWTPTLTHYTRYKEEDLRECAKEMNDFLQTLNTSEKTRAVVTKYSKSSLLGVASIRPIQDIFGPVVLSVEEEEDTDAEL